MLWRALSILEGDTASVWNKSCAVSVCGSDVWWPQRSSAPVICYCSVGSMGGGCVPSSVFASELSTVIWVFDVCMWVRTAEGCVVGEGETEVHFFGRAGQLIGVGDRSRSACQR